MLMTVIIWLWKSCRSLWVRKTFCSWLDNYFQILINLFLKSETITIILSLVLLVKKFYHNMFLLYCSKIVSPATVKAIFVFFIFLPSFLLFSFSFSPHCRHILSPVPWSHVPSISSVRSCLPVLPFAAPPATPPPAMRRQSPFITTKSCLVTGRSPLAWT